MVKLLRLLIKGGYIFKDIVSASGTYRTLRGEGVAADRALVISVLLQNYSENYFIEEKRMICYLIV